MSAKNAAKLSMEPVEPWEQKVADAIKDARSALVKLGAVIDNL